MLMFGYGNIQRLAKPVGDELLEYNYFKGRLTSTAIDYDNDEWDSETEYDVRDKVWIPELKRVFISTVPENKGNAPWNRPDVWWSEGSNSVASLDQIESSISIHPQYNNAVETFSLEGVSHIVGMRIRGAKRVIISHRRSQDDGWEEILRFNLTKFVGFKGCNACCSVIYYNDNRYVVQVDKDMCIEGAEVKVELVLDDEEGIITVGTQVPVFAYLLGCINSTSFGANPPKNYEVWTSGGKINKVINYIERYIKGNIVVNEVKMWENYAFLMDKMNRKHFYWLEHSQQDEIGLNPYDNSLLFGSYDGLKFKADEKGYAEHAFSITGVEQ